MLRQLGDEVLCEFLKLFPLQPRQALADRSSELDGRRVGDSVEAEGHHVAAPLGLKKTSVTFTIKNT